MVVFTEVAYLTGLASRDQCPRYVFPHAVYKVSGEYSLVGADERCMDYGDT